LEGVWFTLGSFSPVLVLTVYYYSSFLLLDHCSVLNVTSLSSYFTWLFLSDNADLLMVHLVFDVVHFLSNQVLITLNGGFAKRSTAARRNTHDHVHIDLESIRAGTTMLGPSRLACEFSRKGHTPGA
jgi:hypothetical protein